VNDAQREPRDEQSDEFDEAEGFEIPVHDAESGLPASPVDEPDWTRTESVRDDPESLGAEARKLWDAVYSQFLQPLVHNYPEAAGHLTSAGDELASAVRSLIRGSEQLWAGNSERNADPSAGTDVVVEVLQDEAPAETEEPGDDVPEQD
jgi:hypothetical protein